MVAASRVRGNVVGAGAAPSPEVGGGLGGGLRAAARTPPCPSGANPLPAAATLPTPVKRVGLPPSPEVGGGLGWGFTRVARTPPVIPAKAGISQPDPTPLWGGGGRRPLILKRAILHHFAPFTRGPGIPMGPFWGRNEARLEVFEAGMGRNGPPSPASRRPPRGMDVRRFAHGSRVRGQGATAKGADVTVGAGPAFVQRLSEPQTPLRFFKQFDDFRLRALRHVVPAFGGPRVPVRHNRSRRQLLPLFQDSLHNIGYA